MNNSFIKKYVQLNKVHANGTNIWELCEMSYEAYRLGDAMTLALACSPKLSVDTIYGRSDAWRSWRVFRRVELRDENGYPLDFNHDEIRERLYYNHFVALGKAIRQQREMLKSGEIPYKRIDLSDVGTILAGWVGGQASTRQAQSDITEIMGKMIPRDVMIGRVKRWAVRQLGYGDAMPKRMWELVNELARTDWI